MLCESCAVLLMLQSALGHLLHAVSCMLCFVRSNAVGLGVVTSLEQQYDAVMNQSLCVLAMLYHVDGAALLLVSICCML